MKHSPLPLLVIVTACQFAHAAPAFSVLKKSELGNFDPGREQSLRGSIPARARNAVAQLKLRLPGAAVEFDPVSQMPRWVRSSDGFLTGRDGQGRGVSAASARAFAADDPHRAAKAFLREHRDLFGHGPEALDSALLKREFTSARTGLRTAVWEQQLDGIPVCGGTLISHTTRDGELVNLGSRFVPQSDEAADKRAVRRGRPRPEPALTARQAVVYAARNLGETQGEDDVQPIGPVTNTPERRQKFAAPSLRGDTHARLVWRPVAREELRLCWEVILTSRTRGEMFRVLVDAESGEVRARHGLTHQLADASFRVFTSDSPSPFSPGWPVPDANQPLLTTRTLVTLSARNTNASPLGWIADGGNETLGNNVDAHLDRDGDDAPDVPRPHGSPARVFDFPLDLTQEPDAYGAASVVQLFYWANWLHDRFWELGFTEAAGNFQTTNFGRGGVGGDAILVQSQDGAGTDNANISVPPEGYAPVIQMFVFTSPAPPRDSSFDMEVFIHEYTHGLSNRRVGGGEGLFAAQSQGMGEGWSDFYALALLSAAGDDLDGTYPAGGYISYQLGGLMQNYYFGIRRYPYSTDLNKNPLTFADIDPDQAALHEYVPLSPLWAASNEDPAEVHAQGEVWCVTLWEARAALIRKHGFSVGNELILQLVTDGMNLSPPDPGFVEARDAILQADRVLTGGANQQELWTAFARRGLGVFAAAPSSYTTYGVEQSFEAPGDLGVVPGRHVTSYGPRGGPFTQTSQTYTITNTGTNPIVWSATKDVAWLGLSGTGGAVPGGGEARVTLELAASAYALTAGVHTASVVFSNHATGRTQLRTFTLRVAPRDNFVESWSDGSFDLAYTTLMFSPNGSENFYSACREPATNFPTDPSGGQPLVFGDPFGAAPEIDLPPGVTVSLFGVNYSTFFVGPGYINFRDNFLADIFGGALGMYAGHFAQPRIATGTDIGAAYQSLASWKLLPDRVAITFQTTVYRWATNAQVELFFDGTIRLTFLDAVPRPGAFLMVGLAEGVGFPDGFQETDLSGYGPCLRVTVPARAREGDGTLAGQGRVTLPAPAVSDVSVRLSSLSPANVTVPNRVVVPAGGSEAIFNLTILDDALLDGTQDAVIQARAQGFGVAEASFHAEDNESAALTLLAPASVDEAVIGGIFEGVVSMNAVPASDITVLLSSSDPTELKPQPSVVIPSGQTSAVFQVWVMNDTFLDGTKTTTLTGHVAHWSHGAAAVTVEDDELLGLSVALPPEICEGPVVLPGAGAVLLTGASTSNLTVSLSSSHPGRVGVPPTVTVAAGNSFASFDLILMDNTTPDPVATVVIAASTPGFADGNGTLLLQDDETPSAPFNLQPESGSTAQPLTLRLSWESVTPLENTVANGDFETGTLNGGPWVISSTDDEFAWFYINAGRFDPYGPERPTPPYAGRYCAVGDQLVQSVITLAQNLDVPACEGRVYLRWVDRIRNFADRFTDHQRYWVTISPGYADFARPGGSAVTPVPRPFAAGTNEWNERMQAGRRRARPDAVQAAVPSPPPPGNFVSFEPIEVYATQPGDPLLNEWLEREVEITRFRGSTIKVNFNVEATLNFFTIFIDNVSAQAVASTNAIVYDVYVGTTPQLGPGNLIGTTTNTFFDAPSLAPATEYHWQVVARKNGTAPSDVATFHTRGLEHFEWSSIAPTQFLGQPILVTLTARDELGRVMTNYPGPVPLGAFRPAETNPVQVLTFLAPSGVDAAQTNRSNTLAAIRTQFSNVIETVTSATNAAALEAALAGKHVLLVPAQDPSIPLTQFTARGAAWRAALERFVRGGGTVLVCSSYGPEHGLFTGSGLWQLEKVEPTPIHWTMSLNSTHPLMAGVPYPLEYRQHAVRYATVEGTILADFLPVGSYNGGLPTGTLLVRDFYPGRLVMIGADFMRRPTHFDIVIGNAVKEYNVTPAAPVVFSPTTAAPFSQGAWTGAINFSAPAAKVFLRATDDAGVMQDTAPFAVLAPNDVALTLTVSAEPAALNEDLAYLLTVTNTGPSDAQMVKVTNHLPSTVTYVSATSADANCSHSGNEVRCEINRLDAAQRATIQIVVRPNVAGSITNVAALVRQGADFYAPNNTARVISTIAAPALFVENTRVAEGDVGMHPARFTVRMQPASSRLVFVRFATSDLTAKAGSDYLATNGLIVFSGGETNRDVFVPILGDLASEDEETFRVTLSSPTNAALGHAIAEGTIFGNDAIPSIIIPEASAREGELLTVRAYLSGPSGHGISLTVATENYTARAPDDFEAVVATLGFPPGVTNASFTVTTRTDTVCEGTESFSFIFSNVFNAQNISSFNPVILDGPVPPVLALADVNLTAESFDPPNRLIDPGEQVSVTVTPRIQCEGHATNVIITLLPNAGVTAPSGSVVVGPLGMGATASPAPFSFTATGSNGAPLALTFEFRDGTRVLNTQTLRLYLGPAPDFAIASLSTSNCQVLDVSGITGSYYSFQGAAVMSSSNLFYSGPNGLGGFPLENLGAGRLTGFRRYNLVSNLRTETVYVLADGEEDSAFFLNLRVTALLEVDGVTGELTGNRIALRPPLEMEGSWLQIPGIYSGHDRIVLHAPNDDVFSIALPWGDVTRLGRVSQGQHLATSGGAYWGVTEHFGGADYLVYPRDSAGIARKRISDGFTTILASFDNLGGMGAITVSIPRHRWGFGTTTDSQFLNTSPTVGLCDATFLVAPELRITSIVYEGPSVTIRFPTLAGLVYRLERASGLSGEAWTAVPPDVSGTGEIMSVTETAVEAGAFYRLRVVR